MNRSTLVLVLAAAMFPPQIGWFSTPALSQEASDTLVLDVEGMWNDDCEEYVEEVLLGDLDGIHAVRADHKGDQVSIDFDPNEVSAEELAGAIEDCPSYTVAGSETHDLDLDEVRRSRRRWCGRCDHDSDV